MRTVPCEAASRRKGMWSVGPVAYGHGRRRRQAIEQVECGVGIRRSRSCSHKGDDLEEAASTAKWSLSHCLRESAPWTRTFHSPSPAILSPVESRRTTRAEALVGNASPIGRPSLAARRERVVWSGTGKSIWAKARIERS